MDREKSFSSVMSMVAELESLVQEVAFDIVRDDGDYELSETLLGMAMDIRTIGRRIESLQGKSNKRVIEKVRVDPPSAAAAGKSQKRKYPKFIVANDNLTKIGKGKSRNSKEYRHESPREAFTKLTAWFDVIRSSGMREWKAEDAVEALAGEVPSYQTYLMLSAMREGGLLHPVRRGTYEISQPDISPADYWSVLRSKFGSNDTEISQ